MKIEMEYEKESDYKIIKNVYKMDKPKVIFILISIRFSIQHNILQ